MAKSDAKQEAVPTKDAQKTEIGKKPEKASSVEILNMESKATPKSSVKTNQTNQKSENQLSEVNKKQEAPTMEQLDNVRKVLKTQNYYKILGIDNTATCNDIKVAYGKKRVILDPKKNNVQGSQEAFNMVEYAANYLLNGEKRKAYDLALSKKKQQRQQQQLPKKWSEKLSAKLSMLLCFVFICLISILVSMLSESDSVFSLEPTSKYTIRRETIKLKVPFYVKENFCSTYQDTVCKLENNVEDEFIANLKKQCKKEHEKKESFLAKARKYQDDALLEDVMQLAAPSCKTLQKYEIQYKYSEV